MSRVLGIDHVQLAMPPGGDDAARAFYGGVLGLAEVPKPPAMAARGGLWFENDVVKVHLGVEPGFRPSAKAHVAFVVAEVRAVVAAAREGGHQTAEAADDGLVGIADRAYVYDPFGNRIELMQRVVAR